MDLDRLRRNWENLGRNDPLWAVLTKTGKEGGRWSDAEFFATGVEFGEWLGSWILRSGEAIPKGTALDFGCGVGRLTQALAAYFDRTVGVDISEPMLEVARQKNKFGAKVEYVCNPRPDLSIFADGTFDFAQSVIVLQHMRKDYAVGYIKELVRVLRPGGLLFFQVPTAVRTPIPDAQAPDHEPPNEMHMEMHVVPAEEVRAAIAAAGGTIVREEKDLWAGHQWDSAHWLVRKG